MEMNKKVLQEICKDNDLYRTPELNDKLYCNFKGFKSLSEDLGLYTGLRALFLEGNALQSLEDLPALPALRCLYLQQNLISNLRGIEKLQNLDTLNISSNRISSLNCLSQCKNLKTLLATNNHLQSRSDLLDLASCIDLQTIDIQNNKIDDTDIIDIFEALPDLRCLYLKGNPVVSKIKNYRKTLIISLTHLTYLDDRPVFENERRTVGAWDRGGLEEERKERLRIKEEEDERNRVNFEYMKKIRQEGWRKRREAMGLPPGNTDPYLDQMSSDDTENSDAGLNEEVSGPQSNAAEIGISADPIEGVSDLMPCMLDYEWKQVENECKNAEADAEIYYQSLRDNAAELEMEYSELRQKYETKIDNNNFDEVEETNRSQIIRDSNCLNF